MQLRSSRQIKEAIASIPAAVATSLTTALACPVHARQGFLMKTIWANVRSMCLDNDWYNCHSCDVEESTVYSIVLEASASW